MFTVYFIAMAFVSNSSPSEDNNSGTDLSNIHMEDEEHIDTTTWMPAKWKKLQHMVEFHEEYQDVFGEKASIHMIMKNRITHMNPPMPDSVCKEEMQNATIENDVIIEYITDAQGRKGKKLKPLLIKSEPDREYIQHIHSDDNLLNVPEDNFMQKREVTIDSYSETISADSSSDDKTITAETPKTLLLIWRIILKIIHLCRGNKFYKCRSFITLNSFWTPKCHRRIYVLSLPYN